MEIHHTKTYRLEQAVLGGKIMAINAYLKKNLNKQPNFTL